MSRLVPLILLLCFPAFGRGRYAQRTPQQIPLMPPRVTSPVPAPAPEPNFLAMPEAKPAMAARPSTYRGTNNLGTLSTTTSDRGKPKGSATGLGFEIGMLGRANKTQNDIAGLQLFGGGRFFARMPVLDELYLVPSLGYFQKRESNGSAGVTQHILEAGLGAYYAAWTGRKARWLVGGVARGEYGIAQIRALNSDSSSAGEFRLRAGPATGAAIGISSEFSFVLDLEVGIAFGQTARVQPGVAAGFIYYLP